MFDEILCVARFAVLFVNHYNTDLLRCILVQEGARYGRMLVDIGNVDPKRTAENVGLSLGGVVSSLFKYENCIG